mmetsp:Transcript_18946/g.36853  ORF Transcript_18946/g.36853 Transcript_18946/m.36853 type:complete len:84 (+) Transcript_18946:318-569(+)
MHQAFEDPASGRPLVTESPFNKDRYRLTDEAAMRQEEHELRAQRRGMGEEATPLGWYDHSKVREAGPEYDTGAWKLGRVGVRV